MSRACAYRLNLLSHCADMFLYRGPTSTRWSRSFLHTQFDLPADSRDREVEKNLRIECIGEFLMMINILACSLEMIGPAATASAPNLRSSNASESSSSATAAEIGMQRGNSTGSLHLSTRLSLQRSDVPSPLSGPSSPAASSSGGASSRAESLISRSRELIHSLPLPPGNPSETIDALARADDRARAYFAFRARLPSDMSATWKAGLAVRHRSASSASSSMTFPSGSSRRTS